MSGSCSVLMKCSDTRHKYLLLFHNSFMKIVKRFDKLIKKITFFTLFIASGMFRTFALIVLHIVTAHANPHATSCIERAK